MNELNTNLNETIHLIDEMLISVQEKVSIVGTATPIKQYDPFPISEKETAQ
jgi:hypothetical protein